MAHEWFLLHINYNVNVQDLKREEKKTLGKRHACFIDMWKFITEIHFRGVCFVLFCFANYFPLLETLNIVITEHAR